jgi:hypothetical protein
MLVALTTLVASIYFTSCNISNLHKRVVKESLDKTTVSKTETVNLASKDSAATKLVVKSDSSSLHLKNDRQILIDFDTSINYGNGSSYDYSIDGTIIKTPQKIKSAIINDNTESNSTSTHKEFSNDSVQVKLLDSNIHSSYDSTKDLKSSKTIDKTKESKRTSLWLIAGFILLIIISGYFTGKKLGLIK